MKRLNKIILSILVLALVSCSKDDSVATPTTLVTTTIDINVVDLNIKANPTPNDAIFGSSVFTKYISVFGVHIYAESGITDAQVKHAGAILAELLDNDEDGMVDDQLLHDKLIVNGAIMPMYNSFESQALPNLENYTGNGITDILVGPEVHPGGSSQSVGFDATLEEMMHLVHVIGHAYAYPSVFNGEDDTSELNQVMQLAISEGTYIPITSAQEGNSPRAKEYIYWGLSTMLGAQNYPGRCAEIASEWTLCTPAQFQTGDTGLYGLLSNTTYKMPTVMPDGNYPPAI